MVDSTSVYTFRRDFMFTQDSPERYWFDQSEEQIMTKSNREFEQVSLEEQLFYRYFRPAKEKEDGEWLSPAEILEDIKKNSTSVYTFRRDFMFTQDSPERYWFDG